MAEANGETFEVGVGSQRVRLPIVTIGEGVRIALLVTLDMELSFLARAGDELAEMLVPARPDVIAAPATLGIPVGIATARAMGHRRYVALQKSPKSYLRDSPRVSVTSVTTEREQQLILDARSIPLVAGKRVALVDDVISTGASVSAGVELLEQCGAEVVAIGALLTEGDGWRAALGGRAALVRSLGQIPFPVP